MAHGVRPIPSLESGYVHEKREGGQGIARDYHC